jgi:hypothetical protein
MTVLDVMEHPALFGPWFKGRTWNAWRVFLAGLFGLTLTPEQFATFHTHTGRTIAPSAAFREAWMIVGRRGGKSRIAALVATYLAAFVDYRGCLVPGERGVVLVIAATRQQAKGIFSYIVGFFDNIPSLSEMVESRTAESLTLKSGIVVEVGTADYRAVRGRTVVACLCDEIAFWPADEASSNPDKEIVAALRPAMLTVPRAMLLGLSSPYARRGVLWDAYRKHYATDNAPVLVWKADTQAMNPAVNVRLIEEAYRDDPQSAAAEYGAEFRSDVEAFLSREAVEAVVFPGRREIAPGSQYHYAAFVDPSGGSQDSMTLAIAHREGDRLVLDATRERRPPFSPESVVDDFADLMKRYRIGWVSGDRYAGEWPREQFGKRGITYMVAEKPKSELYKAFLPEVNSARVELLEDPRLVSQLCALERRTARGGRDTIDHPPNGRDDVANAVAGVIASIAAVAPINLNDYGWI